MVCPPPPPLFYPFTTLAPKENWLIRLWIYPGRFVPLRIILLLSGEDDAECSQFLKECLIKRKLCTLTTLLLASILWGVQKRIFPHHEYTDKKENKIFLKYKEIQRDRVQSHIWLTASSYMGKNLRISSYIRKPFLIYDFAPAPIWISLYMRKVLFSFLSVYSETVIFKDQHVCMGPYILELTITHLISLSTPYSAIHPPLQIERGGLGKISSIGWALLYLSVNFKNNK